MKRFSIIARDRGVGVVGLVIEAKDEAAARQKYKSMTEYSFRYAIVTITESKVQE